MMHTAILAVLLFAIMIFPHELGHFLAARAVGVQVNEFSFGMGPAIWKRKKNGTLYAVRIFPIGGYCAMEGEDEASENDRAFSSKTAGQKFLVLAAGAFMNVVICILLFMIVFSVSGMTTTAVSKVETGKPAYTAGIQKGDRILKVDRQKITSWEGIGTIVQKKNGKPVSVTVERGDREMTYTLRPVKSQGRYLIGIEPVLSHNPARAFVRSIRAAGYAAAFMYKTLGQLITGGVGMKDVSGPVGIVSAVHKTVSYGFTYFLSFAAFISLNLAVINLLPLPALDGGRILFLLIRKIGKNRITDAMEGNVHLVGFTLLLVLTVIVTWHDIVRLF